MTPADHTSVVAEYSPESISGLELPRTYARREQHGREQHGREQHGRAQHGRAQNTRVARRAAASGACGVGRWRGAYKSRVPQYSVRPGCSDVHLVASPQSANLRLASGAIEVKRRFCGLMSRWTTPAAWQYVSAWRRSYITFAASCSVYEGWLASH